MMDTTKEVTIAEAIEITQKRIGKAIEDSNLDPSIIKLILKDMYNQVQIIQTNLSIDNTEEVNQNGEHISGSTED